jgi:hypothetical protein
MQKKLKSRANKRKASLLASCSPQPNFFNLAVLALCLSSSAMAQNAAGQGDVSKESSITLTEAQLGEDDNMSQNVTLVNSNSNVYASEVGYLFSPVRFRYRALNQKYNEVYINGTPFNDMESGQFRYSLVGGLNQQTRNVDFILPFEDGSFAFSGMGGSNNYDFRAANMASGHRITLSGANRNYVMRGMYTYASGLNDKGWAVAANLTYRGAPMGWGIVEGTFYNALSYYLGVQKVWNNGHSLAFSTWGNPTERASQGAATDESYWIANNYLYNPYWGYQNGKKRNSRIINDFAPTALLTWDWDIDNKTKLTTSLAAKYSMYKSTKLDYNNSDNPQPDYWKLLPSSYYDVWGENDMFRTQQCLNDYNTALNYLRSSKYNRQIDFDRLYYSNRKASEQGADAMYFIKAKHNDALMINLSSTLNKQLTENSALNLGFNLGKNFGRHYQTMEDLLGASSYHNINTYALGTYSMDDPQVQYDLDRPNAVVGEGNKFGYDYRIDVLKANLWANYAENFGALHYSVAAKIGHTDMQRKGYMRNGMAINNSKGRSHTANFLDGGVKGNATVNLGYGHAFNIGVGYELRAPEANNAFAAPEINNDYVTNLRNERVFSSEVGYQYKGSWLNLNLSGYYSRIKNATEWTCFYFDDINSFSYVSLTDIEKEYYGVELGAKFKLASFLDLKLIGTMSEAQYANNANVRYMNSTQATYTDDILVNEGMRESGTPLTAASAGLSYHQGGWFIDLDCNYYNDIYLSYSPYYRYKSIEEKMGRVNEDGSLQTLAQEKGHGGFMLDASIGRSIRLKKGSLSVNLMVSNLLNNEHLCTGGYEQSRSDVTNTGNSRAYKFSRNAKKYYAYGTNAMLNIAYKF